MTDPTERQLRELFAADATGAPQNGDLAGGALRRVRHRRCVRTAAAGGLLAAGVVVGGVAAAWSPAGPATPSDVVAEVAPSTAPASTGVGALRGNAAAECVHPEDSPNISGNTQFALSGTVTAIGPSRLPPDVPGVPESRAEVTFQVDTWFRGGAGETVRLHLQKPDLMSSDRAIATYGVGTRLLVSGAIVNGKGYLAWDDCGYTRYYDERTAAEWAAATD